MRELDILRQYLWLLRWRGPTLVNTFNTSAQLMCNQYHLFLVLFVPVYPNLVLIDCCWHKYITSRGLFSFFKDNKSSHTIVSVGVIVITSHVKVAELKGEKKVEDIKIL